MWTVLISVGSALCLLERALMQTQILVPDNWVRHSGYSSSSQSMVPGN